MTVSRVVALALGVALLGAPSGEARAQQTYALGESDVRAPRFFLATSSARGEKGEKGEKGKTGANPVLLDVRRTPVLMQRIVVDLDGVPLSEALAEISSRAGLTLVYADGVVPAGKRVQLRAEQITVVAALTDVLADVGVDVVFNARGGATLVARTVLEGVLPAAGTITGRVTEATSGEPVARAQISVLGTSLGRMTNDSGAFVIAGVPPGQYQVGARRVGYRPATNTVIVADGAVSTLDFALVRSASELEAIVTTVTGVRSKKEMGNVIGTIDADSVVSEAPVTKLADVLGGRVVGLQVMQNTGYTGESPRIRIRGLGSISTSRDPLLVVDGVRVANTTGVNNFTYGHQPGRFNDISPEDIKTIEVVKGPSAATLYGTDAANGVVVITTKRGDVSRPRWQAYAENGRLKPGVDFVDSYYSWGRSAATGAAQRCLVLQQVTPVCVVDSLTRFNPLNDPQTSPIGTGYRSQYGGQVSGGVNQFRYFLAADREEETGYLRLPESERERIAAERGGVPIPHEQQRPNALAKTGIRANVGRTIRLGELSLASGLVLRNTRIPANNVWLGASNSPGFKDANGGWADGRPGEFFGMRSADRALHSTSSLSATVAPREWLTARGTIGLDFSTTEYDGLQRNGEGPIGTGRAGRRQKSLTNLTLSTIDLGASASGALTARLNTRTSVGVQYNRQVTSFTTANATGLPPGSETVTGAATVSSSESLLESIVAGAYIEETINLDDRLFLTAAIRADGASSFGRDFSTAAYPKASISWLISDVPLVQRLPGLTSLRARAAYGASGVQPGAIDALPRLALVSTIVDGNATSGAFLAAIGNPELKPERTTEFETGLDGDWLNGRVRVEATFYNKLSHDALIDRPLPSSVGLTSRRENLGSVRNRGWEGSVSVIPLDSRTFSWDFAATASINRNTLEAINGNVSFPASIVSTFRVGAPIFSRWDRPLTYDDANGNGIIEAAEVQVGSDPVLLGEALAPRHVTLSTGVSLLGKRLRIASQLERRSGNVLLNAAELNRCGRSVCRAVNDRTAPLAQQAAWVGRTTYSTFAGFIEDASFTRWRELSVTYHLPGRIARMSGGENAAVTLGARNLKLWKAFSGMDPEVVFNVGSNFFEGPDVNPTAPQTRYWILRLTIGS